MRATRTLRLALGVALALIFLWLILRQLRPSEIKTVWENSNALWIYAALGAFLIGYACRIERWRLMLLGDNPNLRRRTCAGPFMASFAVNNVLPFRAGDVLRSFAFNGVLGTSSGVVVATLFVERLLDLLMVLLLLGAALALFGVEVARFAGVGGSIVLGLAAVIASLLLFPNLLAPFVLAAGSFTMRLAPRLGQPLNREISRSLDTLRHLTRGVLMFKLILWSLAAWVAEGCVFWFAAIALPAISRPQAGWLALPVGAMATLIPSTPGYVGTFDYFVIHAMREPGNEIAVSTVYALLVHALLWLPPTVLGGLYMVLRPAALRGVHAAGS
jgi:glycosyltransferase 2 family protein